MIENVWKLFVEVDDLRCYFADLNVHHLSNREFIFLILETFKDELLKRMIYNARRFRATDAAEDENDFVYINDEIYNEISKVMTQKRKKIINHF